VTDVALDSAPEAAPAAPPSTGREVIYRHSVVVRVTHWINLICLTVLLMTGLQIFNAHPMLYWGQYGADADPPVLSMALEHGRGITRIGPFAFDTTGVFGLSGGEARGYPAWATWPTHRNLALGRSWHFFMAWLFVTNGLTYLVSNAINGHFKRDLAPTRQQLRPSHIWRDIIDHIKLKHPVGEEAKSFNVLQKFAYLSVVFILLPGMVLTGLTMSPGFDAFCPLVLSLFGGRQSARTLHFIFANLIVLFVIVHVVEVFIAGVFNEIGSMITGRYTIKSEPHS